MKLAKDPAGGRILPATKGVWYVGTNDMSEQSYELVKVLGEPYKTNIFGKTGGRYINAVDCIIYRLGSIVGKRSFWSEEKPLPENHFFSPVYYREARPIDFHIFMGMLFE
jgi:hypothetical protein